MALVGLTREPSADLWLSYVVPVERGTVALRRPSTGAAHQVSAGPGPVPTMPGVPTLLTLDEVADELAVSRSQVYALVRRQDLPALKIGGKGAWRVERTALDLWLQKVRDDTARWLRDNPLRPPAADDR